MLQDITLYHVSLPGQLACLHQGPHLAGSLLQTTAAALQEATTINTANLYSRFYWYTPVPSMHRPLLHHAMPILTMNHALLGVNIVSLQAVCDARTFYIFKGWEPE